MSACRGDTYRSPLSPSHPPPVKKQLSNTGTIGLPHLTDPSSKTLSNTITIVGYYLPFLGSHLRLTARSPLVPAFTPSTYSQIHSNPTNPEPIQVQYPTDRHSHLLGSDTDRGSSYQVK